MKEKDGRHKNYKQSWIWERGKLALSNEKVERENINPIPTIREVENEPNGHVLRPKRRKWKVQARKKDKIEKKKSKMQNWPISAKRPVSEVREAFGAIPEAKWKKICGPMEFSVLISPRAKQKLTMEIEEKQDGETSGLAMGITELISVEVGYQPCR